MAIRKQLGKAGSTLFSRLRVVPMFGHKAVAGASPATPDPVFNTLKTGGAFLGSGSTTSASPAATISIPDLTCVAAYTPVANNTPTVTAGASALVVFDTGSVPFPIKAGDVLMIGNQGNLDLSSGVAAVDALTNVGLYIDGPPSITVKTGVGTSSIQIPVYNPSGGSIAVPAGWLPVIYILRFE